MVLMTSFVNVGPDLAREIPDPGEKGKNMEGLLKSNPNSMFIS